MKKHLLLAALLVSTSAFACPELTGTWACKDMDNNESTITVTQEAIQNGALYHIKDAEGKTEDVYADGVSRPVEMQEYKGTMVAKCTSQNRIEAKVDFENPSYALVGTADVSIELTGPQTLVTKTNVSYSMNGGAPNTQITGATCTR